MSATELDRHAPPMLAFGGVPPPKAVRYAQNIPDGRFNYLYNEGMTTFYAYVTSPEHAYPGHPENIERFSFLDKLLQDFPGIERIDAQPAHLDEIKRVHTQDMITGIESA
ncbi:MAG: hypothetical protein MUP03_05185, partial [Anaerolineales bacterium]|nr:hypothetical protein [Anaerolineales bacterium]